MCICNDIDKADITIKTAVMKKICKYHKKKGQEFHINEIVPRGMCFEAFSIAYPSALALLYNANAKTPGCNKWKIEQKETGLNKAKQKENYIELILVGNVLIREQVKLIYESMMKKSANSPALKFSILLSELLNQPIISGGSSVKIVAKKNLRAVKLWKNKFDVFFKSLKREIPTGLKPLADETLKIAAMLQTTVAKC